MKRQNHEAIVQEWADAYQAEADLNRRLLKDLDAARYNETSTNQRIAELQKELLTQQARNTTLLHTNAQMNSHAETNTRLRREICALETAARNQPRCTAAERRKLDKMLSGEIVK